MQQKYIPKQDTSLSLACLPPFILWIHLLSVHLSSIFLFRLPLSVFSCSHSMFVLSICRFRLMKPKVTSSASSFKVCLPFFCSAPHNLFPLTFVHLRLFLSTLPLPIIIFSVTIIIFSANAFFIHTFFSPFHLTSPINSENRAALFVKTTNNCHDRSDLVQKYVYHKLVLPRFSRVIERKPQLDISLYRRKPIFDQRHQAAAAAAAAG